MKFDGLRRAALDTIRRNAAGDAQREKNLGVERSWAYVGGGIREYTYTFDPLFDEPDPIHGFVERRRREGKDTLALDLMGTGAVLRELEPDFGLAVTLTDQRDLFERNNDAIQAIDVIAGDATTRNVWSQVGQWLANIPVQDKRFNMILERGIGAHTYFPDDPEFNLFFIQQLWDVLSDDGGMLVATIPSSQMTYMDRWRDVLKQVGVELRYSMVKQSEDSRSRIAVMRLTKNPGAPDILPGLPAGEQATPIP